MTPITHPRRQQPNTIHLPPARVHLPQRDGALLLPEPMRAHPRDQDGGAVAGDGQGDADAVEAEARGGVGHEALEVEELGDQDALHGEGEGGADVGEEGSFEGCWLLSCYSFFFLRWK